MIEEKMLGRGGFVNKKEQEDIYRRGINAYETRLQQFCCLYFVSMRSKACNLTSAMAWNEQMLWLRVVYMEQLFFSVVIASTAFSLSPVPFLGCL